MQALHKRQQGKTELEVKLPGEVFSPGFAALSALPDAIKGSESAQEQTPLARVVGAFAPLFIRLSILSSGDGSPGAGKAAGG